MPLDSRYVFKQQMTTFSKWKPPIPRNILLNFCWYKSCISFAVWYTPSSDQRGQFSHSFCISTSWKLTLYRAKVHSLYCLANSFFFHDKSISSPGETFSGILPLKPNSPIFISSWLGTILSSNFRIYGEPEGFLPRAFGEFSFSLWLWNNMRIV